MFHFQLVFAIPVAQFQVQRFATQHAVHGIGHIAMHKQAFPFLNLDQYIKSRWGAPFKNCFLRPTPPRFFIREGNTFDAANQVGERGVQQQILQGVAVRRTDSLHAAFINRARRSGFLLAADLVDDDHFRAVIFNSLDHRFMLV